MLKNKDTFLSVLSFFTISMVVLLSLGKTINYYFYTDDYALLYHLQKHLPYGWPYDYIVIFFTPLFKLFGLWAQAYFALGVLTFFLASLGVYFFIKVLTKNKLIAYLSSIVFATGYIGLDQFTMMSVSSINNLNIITMCIVLILFILWLDTSQLRYYFLTLLIFWFSMWIFPFRAFPLILFLPTLKIIKSFHFNHVANIIKQVIFLVIWYIPFVLIASRYGVFSYGTHSVQDKNPFSILTGEHSIIFDLLNFDFFKQMLAVIGRFILTKPISDTLSLDPNLTLYFYSGLIFVIAILLVSLFFLFGKKSVYARSLIAVSLLTIEGYFGYMILNLDFDTNGPINRYLTTSFLFFSAVFPLFLFLLLEKVGKLKWINKKNSLIFLTFIIVFAFTSLAQKYEDSLIQDRSIPAKSFLKQLKSFVPQLAGKNTFYFDVSNNYPASYRFGSIVLGAYMKKEVVLASSYNVDINSIEIVDTFNEYISLKKNKPGGNFYSFYYDNKGLHQTTDKISSLFENGDRREVNPEDIEYPQNNLIPNVSLPVSNFYSLIPMKLNVALKITPLPFSSFKFPYYGITSNFNSTEIEEFYKKNIKDKAYIYNYLLSRKHYYENVSVEASSSHVEGQNPAEFLVDDKAETIWLANENSWQVSIKPWIKIDQKEQRKISKIVLRQVINRILSNYKILTSLDGITWEQARNIHISKSLFDDSLIINDFDPVTARYVMFKIISTKNGSTPGLSEIEVIEDKYKDVDVPTGIRIKNNPFEFIRNEGDLQLAYDYIRQAAFLKVLTKTNKDENISNNYSIIIPILLDDQYHEYKALISPRGINLEKIKFELNFPARIEVGKMEINHQQLRELNL